MSHLIFFITDNRTAKQINFCGINCTYYLFTTYNYCGRFSVPLNTSHVKVQTTMQQTS